MNIEIYIVFRYSINVWTPFGNVDASAKRCEAMRSAAKGHQCSPVGNTAFMFLP